jgi:hypothetical protein
LQREKQVYWKGREQANRIDIFADVVSLAGREFGAATPEKA